jgi:hypothetical protein
MKVGIIIYHKNLMSFITPEHLIDCIKSIRDQTYDDFDIIELNYGEKDTSYLDIFSNFFPSNKKIFMKEKMNNHVEAMNYLLNKTFNELCYDVIFNINLDDVYELNRFEVQLKKVKEGYDVIGSSYNIFQEIDGKVTKREYLKIRHFDDEDDEETYYKMSVEKNRIILNLSSCCFTKKAWKCIKKIQEIIPLEGLLLSRSIFEHNLKLHITPEVLLNYRIHENQTSCEYKTDII